jgi:hypothetical protein
MLRKMTLKMKNKPNCNRHETSEERLIMQNKPNYNTANRKLEIENRKSLQILLPIFTQKTPTFTQKHTKNANFYSKIPKKRALFPNFSFKTNPISTHGPRATRDESRTNMQNKPNFTLTLAKLLMLSRRRSPGAPGTPSGARRESIERHNFKHSAHDSAELVEVGARETSHNKNAKQTQFEQQMIVSTDIARIYATP